MVGVDPKLRAKLLGSLRDEVDLFDRNASVYVNLGWLPLVCLMVFIVAFSLGFGPLAWAMNVELFPR